MDPDELGARLLQEQREAQARQQAHLRARARGARQVPRPVEDLTPHPDPPGHDHDWRIDPLTVIGPSRGHDPDLRRSRRIVCAVCDAQGLVHDAGERVGDPSDPSTWKRVED
jgi:hypothetical protein